MYTTENLRIPSLYLINSLSCNECSDSKGRQTHARPSPEPPCRLCRVCIQNEHPVCSVASPGVDFTLRALNMVDNRISEILTTYVAVISASQDSILYVSINIEQRKKAMVINKVVPGKGRISILDVIYLFLIKHITQFSLLQNLISIFFIFKLL